MTRKASRKRSYSTDEEFDAAVRKADLVDVRFELQCIEAERDALPDSMSKRKETLKSRITRAREQLVGCSRAEEVHGHLATLWKTLAAAKTELKKRHHSDAGKKGAKKRTAKARAKDKERLDAVQFYLGQEVPKDAAVQAAADKCGIDKRTMQRVLARNRVT